MIHWTFRKLFLSLVVAPCVLAATSVQAAPFTLALDTADQLANNFNQEPAFVDSPYYSESPGGGSVAGYSGQTYTATAVYTGSSFAFGAGSTLSLSLDLFYNGSFKPLAPGANAVQSFRLGLLSSLTSAFETFGQPSIYVEGLHALDRNEMLLPLVSQTKSVVTSGGGAQGALSANHWLRIAATFSDQPSDQIAITGSLSDLGPDGTLSPSLIGSADQTWTNPDIAELCSVYIGFSALAEGGIPSVRNLVVPSPPMSVPEPASALLLASGLVGSGLSCGAREGHTGSSSASRLAAAGLRR